jgi:hypothetical protein
MTAATVPGSLLRDLLGPDVEIVQPDSDYSE